MIFDFLFKKEYISCERLEYGINIYHQGLAHCDMNAHLKYPMQPVSVLKNGKYNFNDFFKKKKEVRKMHRNGKINYRCEGCYNLEKKIWDTRVKITHIDISSNMKCNSDCIYCFSHTNKKYFNQVKDIPVYEIIHKMVNKKIIDKNCEIQIGGGEPVILEEFEQIMFLLLDNNFDNINIYSSGIKYSYAIEKALKKDACKIYISPDSGESELYKRIKNTDKFNEVWNNIKRYCEAQNRNKEAVWIKYIIIPDINDDISNINKFLQKVIESEGHAIAIDIEREWYKRNKNNKNKIEEYIHLIKYTEKFCKANNIKYIHFPTALHITKDFKTLYDDINF